MCRSAAGSWSSTAAGAARPVAENGYSARKILSLGGVIEGGKTFLRTHSRLFQSPAGLRHRFLSDVVRINPLELTQAAHSFLLANRSEEHTSELQSLRQL